MLSAKRITIRNVIAFTTDLFVASKYFFDINRTSNNNAHTFILLQFLCILVKKMNAKSTTAGFTRIIVIVLIVISAAVGLGIWKSGKEPNISLITDQIKQIPGQPSPTTMPFYEMTIPGLRGREYKSSLSELSKYHERPNYTSYLTSYDSDGLKVNGLLTIPKGSEPQSGWPAVVFVHGYIAPTIYTTTEKYVEYIDYLARNGFVVFKIDLRGHGSSEGDAGGGYYSSDYVIDTLNAYAALQNTDYVNKNAIGLWGHSMAGNVTSRAWAAKPDIPAIVVWAGAVYSYTDLIEYRIQDNSYRPPQQNTERERKRKLLREAHGEFDPNDDFWKQVPMTNYMSDLKGAIEIHHAIDDTVVSVEYSRNLMKLMDETSVPHKLYEYSNGGHNINGSSFSEAMGRTVEFYKNKLK
jgi:uncharacterized protein